MIKSRRLNLSLAVGLVACALAAQKADPPPPDPALGEKIKLFQSAIKDRKRARDVEATGLVDQMLIACKAGVHPKDRKAVLKALEECLTSSRVKRQPAQKGIFVAVAHALGNVMGAEGARVLVKAYASPKFEPERDWIELRTEFLRCVGKTKDPKQIKFLLERARRDPHDAIMRAAGEALGNYHELDQKWRKDIAKQLIKKFSEIHGKSLGSLNPGDPIVKKAKDTLASISRDWNATLKKLTGQQDIERADEWQRFYNKNKGKNWAKL